MLKPVKVLETKVDIVLPLNGPSLVLTLRYEGEIRRVAIDQLHLRVAMQTLRIQAASQLVGKDMQVEMEGCTPMFLTMQGEDWRLKVLEIPA